MNRKTKIILIIVVFLTSSVFVNPINTNSDEIDYPYPAFVWDIEPEDYVGEYIFLQFTAFTEHIGYNETYGVKYIIYLDGMSILESVDFVPYYINEPINIDTETFLSGIHQFTMTVYDYWNRTSTLSKGIIIDKTPPSFVEASISNTTIEEGSQPYVSWKIEEQYFQFLEILINQTRYTTSEFREAKYYIYLHLGYSQMYAYFRVSLKAWDLANNTETVSWVVYYYVPEDRFPKYSEEELESLIGNLIENQSQARMMGLGLGMGITIFATIGLFPGRLIRKVLKIPKGLRGT